MTTTTTLRSPRTLLSRLTAIGLALWISGAGAAPPATMSLQGYLTSSGGTPVNGNVSVVFRLYTVATAGSPLWTETQPAVAVSSGVYSVTLGSVTPISLPFDTPYFLGVTVGADAEMAPRMPLTSVGYAFRAAQADVAASAPLADGSVTTAKIADAAVTASKLASSGCTGGQSLQYNGSAWVCVTVGGGGVADGSITTAKLADGAVTAPKLASGAVTFGKLGFSGACTSGQVLGNNGTSLTCATPGGSGFFPGDIALVPSTSTAGKITKGPLPFLHDVGVDSIFLGVNAGNYSLTGAGNAAVGVQSLQTLSTGVANTALGTRALQLNSTGNFNTGVGYHALQVNTGLSNTALGAEALLGNTSGGLNVAVGKSALAANTVGSSNAAVGFFSLAANTSGDSNVAVGASALAANTAGFSNVAVGRSALAGNTTGLRNTAIGREAILTGSGSDNTAVGAHSLMTNTSGALNSGMGVDALHFNTTGANNAALGYAALTQNTVGNQNTATGSSALRLNTSGDSNTASGHSALYFNLSGNNNSALGRDALYFTTGHWNIGIGREGGYNLTTGSYNIAIGNAGVAAEGGTIRIGTPLQQTKAFVAGIRGVATGVGDAVTVLIDSAGQLGTVNSSIRVKDAVADMSDASAALMKLRPVTFQYKEYGPGSRVQYGLVAEEVEEVYPGLVAKRADGSTETVMYHFLPPMLLNEFQKQQRTIESQAGEIAELKRAVAELARGR